MKNGGREKNTVFELSGSRSRNVTQFLFLATQVSPSMLKIAIHFKTSGFQL